MKPNKSPGLDGLPSEFYKCMWDSIKTLFYNALKEIYDRNEMSFSQRLSVISLLYKKDDKKLLKNYRPLSLSNIDYKVIAFCFARRLQKILRKLISVEQSAYVKGRYIGENARTILDIFRAQEPKAPVTYCDHALSGVRPSSVRPSVRRPSSVRLFTFSTSSPEPLDGF